jgi:hypothetical protein
MPLTCGTVFHYAELNRLDMKVLADWTVRMQNTEHQRNNRTLRRGIQRESEYQETGSHFYESVDIRECEYKSL